MSRHSKSTSHRQRPGEFPKPCSGCGTLTRWPTCEDCRPVARRSDLRSRIAHDRKVRRLRPKVLRRDGWCCQNCGLYDPSGATLQIDHIAAWADGGAATPENLRVLCIPCHRAKTKAEGKRRIVAGQPANPMLWQV